MMRELHVRPIHQKSMLEATPKMTRKVGLRLLRFVTTFEG
jgi:hypothetical protein